MWESKGTFPCLRLTVGIVFYITGLSAGRLELITQHRRMDDELLSRIRNVHMDHTCTYTTMNRQRHIRTHTHTHAHAHAHTHTHTHTHTHLHTYIHTQSAINNLTATHTAFGMYKPSGHKISFHRFSNSYNKTYGIWQCVAASGCASK